MQENISLGKIFITYLKIGLMAFGGGYVMLPLIEAEFVNKQKIIEAQEVYQLFSLAQTLPGIVAVNMAIFLGYRLRETRGALVGACGVMLPSIIIITVIASFFTNFIDVPLVQSAFRGLNIAVPVIIAKALWKMAKTNITDKITLGIFIAVFALYLITGLSPIIFAIISVIFGLLIAGKRDADA